MLTLITITTLLAAGLNPALSQEAKRAQIEDLPPPPTLVKISKAKTAAEQSAIIQRSSKLLQKEPSNLTALRARGFAYFETGQNEKCVADLQKILKLQPSEPAVLMMLGSCYDRLGRFTEALGLLNRAIALKADLWPAYGARANVLIRTHHPFVAVNDLNVAIEHEPDLGLYLARAYCFADLERYELGLPDVNKALTLSPADPWARSLHALCLVQSDPIASQREIKSLIAKYPGNMELLQIWFRIETKLKNWQQIGEALRAIVKLDPSNIDAKTRLSNLADARLYQVIQHVASRKSKQNLAALSKAVQEKPTEIEPLLIRGTYYLKNLDYDHAVADFTQAIKIDPKSTFVYVQRGLAYVSLEKYDQAFSDFDQAKKINPANVEALLESARLHRKLHQLPACLADYDRLVALRPGVWLLLNERSAVLILANKPELALRDAQKSVQLHPGNAELKTRANAYLAMKQYAKAIEDCTAALILKPDDLTLYKTRALAHTKLGHFDLAARDEQKLHNFNTEVFENAPFRASP